MFAEKRHNSYTNLAMEHFLRKKPGNFHFSCETTILAKRHISRRKPQFVLRNDIKNQITKDTPTKGVPVHYACMLRKGDGFAQKDTQGGGGKRFRGENKLEKGARSNAKKSGGLLSCNNRKKKKPKAKEKQEIGCLPHLARDKATLGLVPACHGHDLFLVREIVHVVRVSLELGVGEGSRLDAADYLQLSVGQSYLCIMRNVCNRRVERKKSFETNKNHKKRDVLYTKRSKIAISHTNK